MDTLAFTISHHRSRRLGSATGFGVSVVLLLAISMQLSSCTSSPQSPAGRYGNADRDGDGRPAAVPFPAQGSVAPNHGLAGHIALFALPDPQAQVRGITVDPMDVLAHGLGLADSGGSICE